MHYIVWYGFMSRASYQQSSDHQLCQPIDRSSTRSTDHPSTLTITFSNISPTNNGGFHLQWIRAVLTDQSDIYMASY